MKNSALLIFVLFVSFTAWSQQPTLNLLGLTENVNGTPTIRNLQLLEVSSESVYSYTVTLEDGPSIDLIRQAVQEGKRFDSFYLRQIQPNGSTSTSRLSSVTLTDLESLTKNGQQLQRFRLNFEKENKMH